VHAISGNRQRRRASSDASPNHRNVAAQLARESEGWRDEETTRTVQKLSAAEHLQCLRNLRDKLERSYLKSRGFSSMKSFGSVFTLFVAIGAAQTPPLPAPKLSPDTVIAEYGDGKKLTYGEVQRFMSILSPQQQQNAQRSRKEFVERYVLMRRLSEMAEQEKLAETSPYKEALESYRMNMLMQAEINKVVSGFRVAPEEAQNFYDQNKSRFEQVNLKVIYIPFSNSPSAAADGKKPLSEQEAKAKAEQLLKEIKAGADFVKLVKENSEDATTKAKDGDLTVSRSDNLPEAIRTVALALKPGELSDPVRQPNGFYIFRGESVSVKPFAEVRNQIFAELKDVKMKDWLESTTKSLNIKLESCITQDEPEAGMCF
jgi:parvulin-like peptidyl-prolyl isomerase